VVGELRLAKFKEHMRSGMAALVKFSQQPSTESCVGSWQQALRSVDRKIAGRNKVNRIISPEIELM
jgi:hypothetical protein